MIFILGLDGLEFDLVEELDLTNLKQREYGRIEVPISESLGVPASPEVWASFLTGEVTTHIRFAKPFYIEIPLKALMFMRRHINLSLGLGKKLSDRGASRFPKLKRKTFLDHVKSKAINVPYVNHDHMALNAIHDFRVGKISLREAVDRLKAIYEGRKSQILNEVEKGGNVDVVFAFMHFPDSLQHFMLNRPGEVRRHYRDLDDFVSSLKRRIGGSTVFIIVSDHGFDFKAKTHSKYGFYSSNVLLNPRPKRITDFFNLIIEETGEG